MELINLETCSWSICTKRGQMYICVRGIDLASFFDFNIWFCCDSVVFCCDSVVFCCDSVVFCCDSVVFCCDSVVFLVVHCINIAQLGNVHLSLVIAWHLSSIVVSFLHYNLHWDLSMLGTGEGSWPPELKRTELRKASRGGR
jgi:hypothetical protein